MKVAHVTNGQVFYKRPKAYNVEVVYKNSQPSMDAPIWQFVTRLAEIVRKAEAS